jgi:hypothetical protein
MICLAQQIFFVNPNYNILGYRKKLEFIWPFHLIQIKGLTHCWNSPQELEFLGWFFGAMFRNSPFHFFTSKHSVAVYQLAL